MSFRQLLRATVQLCFGSAAVLAVLVTFKQGATAENIDVILTLAWWVVAAVIGIWIGRPEQVNAQISRVLADSKPANQMPESRALRTFFNRLWPILVIVLGSGASVVFSPTVPAIAVGFLMIWALAWRRQESAVQAIEERDGVEFHVEKTGFAAPLQLVRLPGLRRDRAEMPSSAAGA